MTKKLSNYTGQATSEAITEHRLCPICGSVSADESRGGYLRGAGCEVLYRVPANPPLAECDVAVCSNCGFAFSDTPTTQAEFDRYYRTSERYGEEVTGADGWNKERYAITAARLSDLLPRESRECPAVLDIGGSSGFVHRLQLHGINGRVVDTPLAEVKCIGDKAGCVTLCHVLEHVRDLDPAMRNLAAIAETVYAEVPDAARYHEYCETPYGQLNSEHINHFTAEHLRRLFEGHGFAQVASGRGECGDPPPHLSPYVWGFFERAKPAANAVRAYCDRSAGLWAKMEAKLNSLKSQVIAWGAGQLYRKIARAVSDGAIIAAVDRCGGEGILTPDALFGRYDRSVPILVTTIQYRESVLADIQRWGFKNEVITLP